jgi:ribosomal-protein-alanine N-acetyltransferase
MMLADDLDRIMAVMEEAFDPAYGEAWNRRQVSDALAMPGYHYLLAAADGLPPAEGEAAAGFLMSRSAFDEEELLLVGVRPAMRGRGIGKSLIQQFLADAHDRGAEKVFLEMREGNPAELLYRCLGFQKIGFRPNYYRRGLIGSFDAVTFGLNILKIKK